MKSVATYGTVIVIVHAVMAATHGIAHLVIPVTLSLFSTLFVAVVIGLAPFVAARMLWGRNAQVGAWLLFASMLAAFLFGVYNHFIALSPDHVAHVPDHDATPIFQATAYMIMVLEAIGAGIGFWGMGHRLTMEA